MMMMRIMMMMVKMMTQNDSMSCFPFSFPPKLLGRHILNRFFFTNNNIIIIVVVIATINIIICTITVIIAIVLAASPPSSSDRMIMISSFIYFLLFHPKFLAVVVSSTGFSSVFINTTSMINIMLSLSLPPSSSIITSLAVHSSVYQRHYSIISWHDYDDHHQLSHLIFPPTHHHLGGHMPSSFVS